MEHLSTTWRSSWKAMGEAIAFAQSKWRQIIWVILGQLLLTFLVVWFYQQVSAGEGVYAEVYSERTRAFFDYFLSLVLGLYSVFSSIIIIALTKEKEATSLLQVVKQYALPKLLGGAIITGVWTLAVIFSSFLFVIPGLVLFIFWMFSLHIFVLQGGKIGAAFGSSYHFVKGWWWPLLARFMTAMSVVSLISLAAIVPGLGIIVSGILFLLFSPVFIVYYTQTYLELVEAKKKNPAYRYSFPRKFLLSVIAFLVLTFTAGIFLLSEFVLEVAAV